MSFVTQAKEKIKKEYEQYKYNKQLENNPEVVRKKLEQARIEQRERIEIERDKAELKQLQGKSGFTKAVESTRTYLQSVDDKKRLQGKPSGKAQLGTGRNIIYDESPTKNSALTLGANPQGSRSLILSDEKRKGQGVFGHSGGVLGQQEVRVKKPKKAKQGKTIVIKL